MYELSTLIRSKTKNVNESYMERSVYTDKRSWYMYIRNFYLRCYTYIRIHVKKMFSP